MRVLVGTCTFNLCRSLKVFVPLVIAGYVIINHTRTFTTGGNPTLSTLSNFSVNVNTAYTVFILNSLHRVVNGNALFSNTSTLLND